MKKPMKVFVTGADGMLGASICRELINQHYNVVAMTLPNSKSTVLNGLNVQIVKGDILDIDFLKQVMKGSSYVINVAASTSIWPSRSEIVKKVNIEGTRNVMEVADKLKIKRMVHISSAVSFNHGTKENPGNENNLYGGWKFKLDYVDSKYQAQKMLLSKFAQDGFPVIIINPTYMIGPFDSGPSSGKLLIELYKNKLPGYSKGGKNFVYSGDVAKAAVNALYLGRLGECYIAGNENLDYGEFLRMACKIRNKTFRLIKVPTFLIWSIGIFNSAVAKIIRKPPTLSFTAARISCLGQYYSSVKAVQELKIPQTPIIEAIENSLKWFELNGYLNESR